MNPDDPKYGGFSNSAFYRPDADHFPQQGGQHGLYENVSGAYYSDSGGAYQSYGSGYAPDSYYEDHQQGPEYLPSGQDPNNWSQPTGTAVAPGSFYPTSPISPQIFGSPVSAVAYDDTFSAVYVASATQAMSSGRRLYPGRRCHRASMLATHNTVDGMVYSSCAGHPEAELSVLRAVYTCIYGTTASSAAVQQQVSSRLHHIPPHAYRPPYGANYKNIAAPDVALGNQSESHMGINTLLPLSGYVASVSPSAVRVHAHGGLQLADHDVEGMICGTAHPFHGEGILTHISVGGISHGGPKKPHVQCMDLWQGLRAVSSRTFKPSSEGHSMGVACMATSHAKGSVVAGCSDGTIRLLDGSLREVAKVKSHSGGVACVAVSEDGMQIGTTGYGSRPSTATSSRGALYAFPDATVMVYDIRFLGRGGVPHPFAGLRGGPRFLSFLPDVSGLPSNRLLAVSGQSGGGLQIITPFEANENTVSSFIVPQLDQGESVSAICSEEDNLALGTSTGRLLQYRMAGEVASAKSSAGSLFIPSSPGGLAQGKASPRSTPAERQRRKKQPLDMPSYVPPVPSFSMDPSFLYRGDHSVRKATTDICAAFMLCSDPVISRLGELNDGPTGSYDVFSNAVMVTPGKRQVTSELMNEGSKTEGDFLLTVPTSKMGLDLFEAYGTGSKARRVKRKPLPNPNKLLYSSELSSICFEPSLNGRKRPSACQRKCSSGSFDDESTDDGQALIPQQYRMTLRPSYKSPGTFGYGRYNSTGFVPGWDYPASMPNGFAPPVLLLMYFVPEVRKTILAGQYHGLIPSGNASEKALYPELAFLFHQIDSLSRYVMCSTDKTNAEDSMHGQVGVWTPSNFLTALTTMPEADQLQVLDGSPAAADPPRRPEAFYRFLLYQIDKELSKVTDSKLMDELHGIDYISANEFISGSGPPSHSLTRALTVDLAYQPFSDATNASRNHPRFGEVLQHALCREVRLRAWNDRSRSYETIIQRKIATSLPKILSLSCECAGRKEEDGLNVWRNEAGDQEHWLPEQIEVELKEDGSVVVSELVGMKEGAEVWKTFGSETSIPPLLATQIYGQCSLKAQRYRYRLEVVISYVRDDFDGGEPKYRGHHVVHVRVPRQYRKRALRWQAEEATALSMEPPDESKLVLTRGYDPEVFRSRAALVKKQLASLEEDSAFEEDWALINGFVVSNSGTEDARDFHTNFKEPCLVMFRTIDKPGEKIPEETDPNEIDLEMVPPEVMLTRSISNGKLPCFVVRSFSDLPSRGDLVAFDAEFVSVQEEESALTELGSKVTVRETRHALARISVYDCQRQTVIIDDHVLPREPVVDYLTRFSGIVALDLDPKNSPHHLVSAQNAYLKLRLLKEQGCIFVGHGLRQDFFTVNLVVPSHQIIDTVEIFRQDRMRYISLRFLANYVLGRDMQQDTHDSVEDAKAAYELYLKAVEMKKEGTFDKFLSELYEYGQKVDWKVGIDDA